MKIVFLDAATLGKDLDLTMFDQIGTVARYDFSSLEEVPSRAFDADVILTNKIPINASTIGKASHLKLVCTTGTGTNHLDKSYLEEHNIAWRNVSGYSTDSVAQHTFAMLFYLLEKLRFYDDYVKEGHYINDTGFSHFTEQFHEINGKTWGIIGLGNIGRKVAEIAKAFGANVIYYSPSGSPQQPGYRQVDFQTLLSESDILSVHAPLTPSTHHLITKSAFDQMKNSCIFLNLGRGAIVSEQDLADALTEHRIAAAGLDVLCEEPMQEDSPLLSIKDSRRLFITPHIAWASIESRTRLMTTICEQIRAFFSETP